MQTLQTEQVRSRQVPLQKGIQCNQELQNNLPLLNHEQETTWKDGKRIP